MAGLARVEADLVPATRQTAEELLTLINGLPHRQRMAFTLVRIEGLARSEAASRMEIGTGSVDKLLDKALRKLWAAAQAAPLFSPHNMSGGG